MKDESRELEKCEQVEDTEQAGNAEEEIEKLPFSQVKKDESIFLMNFLKAVLRRISEEHKTSAERIDFWIRITYAMLYKVIQIYDLKDSNENWQWIPGDQLGWALLLYPCTVLTNICFNYYVVKQIKYEYLPKYNSREEQVLYYEQRSIIQQIPKKLYIPLFLGFIASIIFSLYVSIESGSLVKITGVVWIDSLLIFLPILPVYFAYSLYTIRMINAFVLNCPKPLKKWILNRFVFQENKNIFLEINDEIIQKMQVLLHQNVKEALIDYRMNPERYKDYQKDFTSLSKLKKIANFEQNDISKHLELLTSVTRHKNDNYQNYDPYRSFKQIFLIMSAFVYFISYLIFNGLGTKIILEQSFLGVNDLSRVRNPVLYSLDIVSNILSLIPAVFTVTLLFKKMMSLLLNKSFDFLKSISLKKSKLPVSIQQHRYLFGLSGVISTLWIMFTLPFETPYVYSNWVFQGYNKEFNFDHVDYTDKDAFLTFYLPAITIFGFLTYPAWRVMTSVFKYITSCFSTEQQRQEIQLEKYYKIWLKLIKSCKPERFLEVLLGFSDEQLNQLVFNGKDPESVLEEVYLQNGMTTEKDPILIDIKNILLARRSEEGINSKLSKSISEVSEEDDEDDEKIDLSHRQHSQNPLTPQDTIRLVVERRKRESKRPQQQREGQIQDNETEPLVHQRRLTRCTLY